jgi:hypothetical protein
MAPSRFAVRLGQGSELLALVMTSTKGPEQQAVKRNLDGVADKTHSDGGSEAPRCRWSVERVAPPGAGDPSCRRHRSGDDGRGRDHDPVVGDMQQPVCGSDRDCFACEVATDVKAMLEDADATGAVGPARHRLGNWRWSSLLG